MVMAGASSSDSYDPRAFPPFAVTVDLAVLTLIDLPVPPKSGRVPRKELAAVLVVRGGDTHAGAYALPGGFVHIDEDLPVAALRELREEVGLELPESAIHQFGVFGEPGRDPRMRVVTVAYAALASIDTALEAGTDAVAVEIVPVRRILDGEVTLAFDHEQILGDAIEFVRVLIEETSAALELCPDTFTITELRHVCEAVWGCSVDRATFNKRVLLIDGFIEPDESIEAESEFPVIAAPATRGRPARRYRRGGADTLHPPLLRPREVLKHTDSWYENFSVKALRSEE